MSDTLPAMMSSRRFFEVAVSTVNLWKVQHAEFSESIRVPKEQADDRVEQSLFRRALGYEHDEVDLKVVGGAIVQTDVRKHYPPDSTAMIFWLKNRRPDLWRDKREEAAPTEGNSDDLLKAMGE